MPGTAWAIGCNQLNMIHLDAWLEMHNTSILMSHKWLIRDTVAKWGRCSIYNFNKQTDAIASSHVPWFFWIRVSWTILLATVKPIECVRSRGILLFIHCCCCLLTLPAVGAAWMGVVEVHEQQDDEVWYLFPLGEIQTSYGKDNFTSSCSVPSTGIGSRCWSRRFRKCAAVDFRS